MAKNIIILSDGTGNTAIKGRGTNVFKLFEAVDLQGHRTDPKLPPQIAVYDDGVGTESFKPLKLIGGAFGYGLARNVRKLYTALARVYEPGDQLFLFGFSRGAFTVRTLAGFIARCGILRDDDFPSDADLRQAVAEGYKAYRCAYPALLTRLFWPCGPDPVGDWRGRMGGKLHPKPTPGGEEKLIRFVGVWDTVAAVGFPWDGFATAWNTLIHQFKFPDNKLRPEIAVARHALSIDDERHTFHPVLWDEENGRDQRIRQVWFSGVHSNVGGGYPKQGMSLITLDWMLGEAEACGLRCVGTERQAIRDRMNINDKLYDSRSGLAAYYRYLPREIARICERNHAQPRIHVSTFERIAQGTDGYAPGNLPDEFEIVDAPPLANRSARLKGSGELLLKVKGPVTTRRYAQLTQALVVFGVLTAWALGWIKSAVTHFALAEKVGWITDLVAWVAVLLAFVLPFAVSKAARMRMERHFSEHWHHSADSVVALLAPSDSALAEGAGDQADPLPMVKAA
ncbi:MAG TPA: DUF2235 domain-containing protein [Thermoanaerobaculia bacterium]|nr:DUF2235 domain-containing protein [Thermoanaerobaculia bacterium]